MVGDTTIPALLLNLICAGDEGAVSNVVVDACVKEFNLPSSQRISKGTCVFLGINVWRGAEY